MDREPLVDQLHECGLVGKALLDVVSSQRLVMRVCMQEVRDLVDEVFGNVGVGRSKRPGKTPIRRPRGMKHATFKAMHATAEARCIGATLDFQVNESRQDVGMTLQPLLDEGRVVPPDPELDIRNNLEPIGETVNGNFLLQRLDGFLQ